MAEYFVSVTAVSAFLGLLSFLSYPSASEKTVKFASSVLLLYTVAMPVVAFVSDIADGTVWLEIDEIVDGLGGSVTEDGEYKRVAEEAFSEGIRRLVADRYGISTDKVEVYVFGYDFENMRADKIKVVMRGAAGLKDLRLVEEYLNGLNMGECEVRSDFG